MKGWEISIPLIKNYRWCRRDDDRDCCSWKRNCSNWDGCCNPNSADRIGTTKSLLCPDLYRRIKLLKNISWKSRRKIGNQPKAEASRLETESMISIIQKKKTLHLKRNLKNENRNRNRKGKNSYLFKTVQIKKLNICVLKKNWFMRISM